MKTPITRVELEVTEQVRYELTKFFCPACGEAGLWAALHNEGAHSGYYGCTHCYESTYLTPWVDADKIVPAREIHKKILADPLNK